MQNNEIKYSISEGQIRFLDEVLSTLVNTHTKESAKMYVNAILLLEKIRMEGNIKPPMLPIPAVVSKKEPVVTKRKLEEKSANPV